MSKDHRSAFTGNLRSLPPLHIDGPRAHPPNCHLVVGFDRNAGSHSALRFAVEFAQHVNAALHVGHSVDPNDLPIDPDSPDYENDFAAASNPNASTRAAFSHRFPGTGPTTALRTIRCTC
ncbi:hypothetical protein GCM10020255_024330 [Rhodococcus baikonurensis]